MAWEVAERLRDKAPVLVVSTAHWAKFGADVYRALEGIPYDGALPAAVAHLTGVQLLGEVLRLAPGQSVPPALAELDDLPVRFAGVVEGSRAGVEGAILGWLGAPS